MALVRPSLTLVLDLDERCATEEACLELHRSYAHISTPLIRTHSEEDQETEPKNKARLIVNFGTSNYLNPSDTTQQENWDEIILPWIKNMLHKLGNNIKIFNDRQRKIKQPEIYLNTLDWELERGNLILALHPSGSGIAQDEVVAFFQQARDLKNTYSQQDALRIEIPVQKAYDEMRKEAWAAWAQDHPEYFENLQKDDENDNEASQEASSKTHEELLEEDIIAKSYENTAVAPTDSKKLPKPVRKQEEEIEGFHFEPDYTMWEVMFSDNTNKTFNSKENIFID